MPVGTLWAMCMLKMHWKWRRRKTEWGCTKLYTLTQLLPFSFLSAAFKHGYWKWWMAWMKKSWSEGSDMHSDTDLCTLTKEVKIAWWWVWGYKPSGKSGSMEASCGFLCASSTQLSTRQVPLKWPWLRGNVPLGTTVPFRVEELSSLLTLPVSLSCLSLIPTTWPPWIW